MQGSNPEEPETVPHEYSVVSRRASTIRTLLSFSVMVTADRTLIMINSIVWIYEFNMAVSFSTE
jgi:hypothetical protein